MLVLILAAIWAAVLLPPWLHNRRERRPHSSIVSFQSQMGTLQRASPAGGLLMGPRMSKREARRRRRDILFTLLLGAGLTLIMAVLLGGPVVALHLLIDVMLVAYVALLVNAQQAQMARRGGTARRASNVHTLPMHHETEPRHALLLRRTGS